MVVRRGVAGGRMVAGRLLLPILLLAIGLQAPPAAEAAKVSDLFSSLWKGYDKQLRPNLGTGKPVVIDTALRINLLYNVDSKEETFQLDLFVNEYWVDSRLAFNASQWNLLNTLRVPTAYVPWLPDTFFFNAIKCSTAVDTSLTLSPTGEVFWSRHQLCTFHSAFDLIDFPFDSQTLAVRRTSFSYTDNELLLNFKTSSGWRPDPQVDFTNSLWDYQSAFSNRSSLAFIQTHSVNAYIGVSRKWLAYLLKMILPMFMLTLLSTLSYAIDPGSPPARVAFSVSLVLSIVTFNSVVSSDLPKINYATKIDWYVWYCFLFVVGALAEFAFVNNLVVSKRYGTEFPFLVDDFAMWTAPYTWIVVNLWYWPIYDSPAVHIILAMAWSGWMLMNVYRVFWWNRANNKRGLWEPMKHFYWYCREEYRRRSDPIGYQAALDAKVEAEERKNEELDAAIRVADNQGVNVFDQPPTTGTGAPTGSSSVAHVPSASASSSSSSAHFDRPPSPSRVGLLSGDLALSPEPSPGDEPNPFDDDAAGDTLQEATRFVDRERDSALDPNDVEYADPDEAALLPRGEQAGQGANDLNLA